MKTVKDIYSRGRGPFAVGFASGILGARELAILESPDCSDFPHRLNRDCDFYINDHCIEYYSPSQGQFTYNWTSRLIIA